jgi:serine/threonine protein kinase
MEHHFPVEGKALRVGTIRVRVESRLAATRNGFVYRAADHRGQVYALKAIDVSATSTLQAALSEHELQVQVSGNPNVVAVCSCSVDQDSRVAFILMELCQTSLSEQMKQVGQFTTLQILEVFQAVCAAVHHIHSQAPPIVHRNLTPENILLSATGWKLGDFGSATTAYYAGFDDANGLARTRAEFEASTPLAYRAPEMIDLRPNRAVGPKVDIWALGCLLYKLCTFTDAFSDRSQILSGTFSWPPDREIHERFKEVVQAALDLDPDARPPASHILGLLYAAFPSGIAQEWREFAPPPKSLAPVARPRLKLAGRESARRATTPDEPLARPRPRISERARKRQAVDLGQGIPFTELDMAGIDQTGESAGVFARLQEQFAAREPGCRQAVRHRDRCTTGPV